MKTNFKNLHCLTEAAIISAVIDHAMKHDMTISVFDGEEWQLRQSNDPDAIRNVVAVSDETFFRFRLAKFKPHVGSVTFIHGNGEDVLSDYGWNQDFDNSQPKMDALWGHVEATCLRG